MKKIIILLLFLSCNLAFGVEELKDVGIAKYAVLEVQRDNVPLRDNTHEDAKRITHLYKDTVLFADKQTKNYYRVELSPDNFAFINKKDVEVQGIIPEKRFDSINKVSLNNENKRYNIKIDTPTLSAYIIKEFPKELQFISYDNHFDPIESKVDYKEFKKWGAFNITKQIANELKIDYVSRRPIFGYDILKTDKGIIYSIKKPPLINRKKPLKKLVVVVDPGHGGAEKGACANNLQEKDINLQISKALKRELKKRHAKVYLTRTKDKKTDLYSRVDFAREKDADILLSIHQNSLADPTKVVFKHGVGTYYYREQSKPLAEEIQKELVLRTGFRDDKVNYASFALTRPTSQLSVLIECGYIIDPYEAKKISDKKFQKTIAKAIVRGVENYLLLNF